MTGLLARHGDRRESLKLLQTVCRPRRGDETKKLKPAQPN